MSLKTKHHDHAKPQKDPNHQKGPLLVSLGLGLGLGLVWSVASLLLLRLLLSSLLSRKLKTK